MKKTQQKSLLQKVIIAMIVIGLFVALSGIADAKGSSFSGGSKSSFGGSSKISTSSSKSSFGGASPSVSTSKASFGGSSNKIQSSSVSKTTFGTGKQTTQVTTAKTTNGKSITTTNIVTKPYTPGTNKITSTSQKTYVNNQPYNRYGRQYSQVYYGPGYDLTSLIMLGYIMSHDDTGKVIYINNATGEMVKEEDIEDAPEPARMPGFESAFALAGLLAMAFIVLRKKS
jgi:hypothetical protein